MLKENQLLYGLNCIVGFACDFLSLPQQFVGKNTTIVREDDATTHKGMRFGFRIYDVLI